MVTGGQGTVTSVPGSISCPGSCSAEFLDGTTVQLTATPATGMAFVGWTLDASQCGALSACQVAIQGAPLSLEARFAATGTAAWVAHFGGTGAALRPRVGADRAGHITVAVGFRGQLSLGTRRYDSADQVDTLVVQFSPTGAIRWSRLISGQGDQVVHRMAVEPESGSVILFGYFGGPTDLGGTSPLPYVPGDTKDFFVARFDAQDGRLRWQVPMHASDNDDPGPGDLSIAPNGEIYVTGGYNTDISIANTPLHSVNSGENEVFLARLSFDRGAVAWARSIGGAGANFAATDIVAVSDESFYIAGNCGGPCTLGGPTIIPRGGTDVVWASYYAGDGSLFRQGQIGGSDDDYAGALTRSYANTAYLAVSYAAVPGEPIVVNQRVLLGTGAGHETVVAELSPADQGPAFRIGGSGRDVPIDLVGMVDGKLLIAGESNSLDLQIGPYALNNQGLDDVYVARIDAVSGQVGWAARIGGNLAESAGGLAAVGQLGVVSGTLSTQVDVLGTTIVAEGGVDAFVAAAPMPR